jgi:hypothetical protein
VSFDTYPRQKGEIYTRERKWRRYVSNVGYLLSRRLSKERYNGSEARPQGEPGATEDRVSLPGMLRYCQRWTSQNGCVYGVCRFSRSIRSVRDSGRLQRTPPGCERRYAVRTADARVHVPLRRNVLSHRGRGACSEWLAFFVKQLREARSGGDATHGASRI